MNRSVIALAGGARIGARMVRMSAPVKTASKSAVNLLSRSRIMSRAAFDPPATAAWLRLRR
jgi:hypothetical protein